MTVSTIKALLDACYQAKRVRELLPALPDGVTPSYLQYLDVIDTLEKLPEWTEESVYTALLNLAAEQGVKNGVILWPARIAMAGKLVTPCGAIEIAVLLGREETLRRMKDSLAKLNA